MSLNRCIFNGRIVRDPEMRHTKNGTMVTTFTIACERDFKDPNTGMKEVDFIECVAWKQQAEYAAKYLKKGSLINIEGRLQIRCWNDKDGNKRKNFEIIVSMIQFLINAKRIDSEVEYDEPVGNNEKTGNFNEEEEVDMDMLPF